MTKVVSRTGLSTLKTLLPGKNSFVAYWIQQGTSSQSNLVGTLEDKAQGIKCGIANLDHRVDRIINGMNQIDDRRQEINAEDTPVVDHGGQTKLE